VGQEPRPVGAGVWLAQDTQRGQPRLALFVGLQQDLPGQRGHASLACNAAMRLLREDDWQAGLADVSLSVGLYDRGYGIIVHGLSQHVGALALLALGALQRALAGDVAPGLLAIERDAMAERLRNAESDPARRADMELYRRLVPTMPSPQQLLAEMAAAPRACPAPGLAAMEMLFYGNCSAEEAAALAARLRQALPCSGTPRPRPDPQPFDSGTVIQVQGDAREPNCALQLYFHLGPRTPALAARALLLCNGLQVAMFQRLRTELQLGYMVGCHMDKTNGALGLSLVVVSSTRAPAALQGACEAFLKDYVPDAQGAEALALEQEEVHTTMNEQAWRTWHILQDGRAEDDCMQVARELRLLKEADMRAFFRQEKPWLAVHVTGGAFVHP
jgi:secreted Zn-dependent insulinase-like peptidase